MTITAELTGFYAPGFDTPGRQRFALGSSPPGLEPTPRTVAIADARSHEPDARDLVRTGITSLAPEGRETHHLSLRFNDGQRWFYYPMMGCDEVIALKLAEFWKTPSPLGNCFHTAFQDPTARPDAEERQSCELRVGVLVLGN